MKRWHVNLFALWSITVVIYGLFGQALDFEFQDWDDPWLITQNPIIQTANSDSIAKILFDFSPSTRRALGKEYLPVRDLSFMTSYAIFGMNPSGYHAVNLNVYILACFALFLLISTLVSNPAVALFSTLLFVVHPAHVEAVAWISERKSALSLLFLLCGILAYLRAQGTYSKLRWLALPLFALAVFAKSTAIVFLPALWIVLRMAGRTLPRKDAAILGVQTIAHLALAVFVGSRAGMVKTWIGGSLLTHALTLPGLWAQYLSMLFVPLDLRTLYETVPSSWGDPRLWVSVATMLGTSALAWRTREKAPRAGWVLLLFTILLLPVLQLIPIPNRFSARYLFLPSICLSLAGAFALSSLRGSLRTAFAMVTLLWILLASWKTLDLLPRWHDCRSLWEEAATRPDQRPYVLTNLFRCHKNAGRFPQALATADRLLAIDPMQPKIWNDLGAIALKQNRIEDARRAFERAYEGSKNRDDYETNLAISFLQENRLELAERYLFEVIRRAPASASAYRLLATLERKRGRTKRAKEYSQKAASMVHP